MHKEVKSSQADTSENPVIKKEESDDEKTLMESTGEYFWSLIDEAITLVADGVEAVKEKANDEWNWLWSRE